MKIIIKKLPWICTCGTEIFTITWVVDHFEFECPGCGEVSRT